MVRRVMMAGAVAAWGLGCGGQHDQAAPAPPRAVTVVQLQRTDPSTELLLTGSVESWKEQQIGFEVSGRVEWMIEPGQDVQGRTVDERGKLLTAGTVLGRLDRTRYELRVAAAEAQVGSAQAEAAATRVDIEQVLPQQLKAAEAARDQAQREWVRIKDLAARQAASASDREQAEAALKAAEARVAQIKATMAARRAELESLVAQVRQAQESVRQARLDLQDCALIAPFTGRVAEVHVVPGAVVQPGEAAVKLIIMDPIRVDVAVSAATDRRIQYGDTVAVYPPGADPQNHSPVLGWVYMKQTVADPATRTFKLTIMIRNRQVAAESPPDPELLKLPRVQDLTAVELEKEGQPGPLFVDTRALHQDGNEYFVWKVENLQIGLPAQSQPAFEPVLRLRRLKVRPGQKRVRVLNYLYRELADPGRLGHLDVLALGVPDGLKDGDRVLFLRRRWMFRPGDLVQVRLRERSPDPGLYVPMEAIVPEGDQRYVFLVTGASANEQQAQKVPVQLLGAVGELRRIEGEGIQEGSRIVIDGAHYLVPGEPVRVVKTLPVAR